MMDLSGNAHMFDLRVLENFLNRIDRSGGYTIRSQGRQPMVPRPLTKLLLKDFEDLVMVFRSGLARRKPRIT